MDPRDRELARILVEYSVRLQPGERVLVTVNGDAVPLAQEVVREVYRVGGVPFVQANRLELTRAWLMGATEEGLAQAAKFEVAQDEGDAGFHRDQGAGERQRAGGRPGRADGGLRPSLHPADQ